MGRAIVLLTATVWWCFAAGAQEDQPFHLKDDVAGESLLAFRANHPYANCKKETLCSKSPKTGQTTCIRDEDEEGLHCDDETTGFSLLGHQFTPRPDSCAKGQLDVRCVNGTIHAYFQHGKLQYVSYQFEFMEGFDDRLAAAISEKYGQPTGGQSKWAPDPRFRDGHVEWCPFIPKPWPQTGSIDRLPDIGWYQWQNKVSRLRLDCNNSSLSNEITLYLDDASSEKDF